MFATVLIVGTLYHKDLILTYAIREGQTCLPGMLFAVRVRGRQERALALRLRREAGGGFRALELGDALYPTPVVSRRGLALARWLARHYVCPLNRAIALFLPPPTQPKQEIRYFVAADWRSRPVLFVEPRWQPLWDGLVKAGDRGMSGERIKARWDGAAAEQAELWYRAGYLRREIGFRRVGQRAGRGGEAVGLEGSLSLTLTADQQKAF
ncbi:MAG: hypothetical protein LBK98_01465, partial [Peptococcaceae bacterium]|nr:hypothetical protein [Peptococcaceae bacterium]